MKLSNVAFIILFSVCCTDIVPCSYSIIILNILRILFPNNYMVI